MAQQSTFTLTPPLLHRWPFRLAALNDRHGWLLLHAGLLMVAFWPFVLLVTPWTRGRSDSNWHLVGLSVCNWVILEAILVAWRQYVNAAELLHEPLEGKGQYYDNLSSQTESWLRASSQFTYCAVTAVILSAACWVFDLAEPSVFSVAVIAVTGLVLGQAICLNTFSVLAARFLRDVPSVNVMWSRPISTPGIAALNRAVQTQARAGLVLLAVLTLPLSYGFLSSRSTAALVVYGGLALFGVAWVIVVGVTLQVWLSEPIRRERTKILVELSAFAEATFGALNANSSKDDVDRLRISLEVFGKVQETPASYWGSGALLRYALAAVPVLAQIVAVVLTVILRK